MLLPVLDFPTINCRIRKNEKNSLQIFDVVRKKFVELTPEEWVRQHMIHFLINQKQVPNSMLSIEKQLILNNTKRRTDIVVYTPELKPLLIVECKAFNVEINQSTINQALGYNLKLNVPFVFLTNGKKHICIQIKNSESFYLHELPNYTDCISS